MVVSPTRLLILAVSLALGICGCSNDLTRSRVAALIEQNPNFLASRTASVLVGHWTIPNYVYAGTGRYLEAKQAEQLEHLEAAGLIIYREKGQNCFCSGGALPDHEYRTELTPRGVEVAKSWRVEQASTEAVRYYVPFARRKLGSVTGLTRNPDNSITAEYTWQWVLTEDGKSLGNPIVDSLGMTLDSNAITSLRRDYAMFQLYDDGWRLTQLAPSNL